MTSREMVQDSATRNQRTLADAVVATNRFRELDARFKSHDGMDLDPSTPEIELGSRSATHAGRISLMISKATRSQPAIRGTTTMRKWSRKPGMKR